MINNDYGFSLKLYLRFESIDKLLTYTSIQGGIAKHYKGFLKPHIHKLGHLLQFPTKNISVSFEELKNLSIELQTMYVLTESAIKKERRKNVLTALVVLKDECESLQKLLMEKLP